MDEKTADDIKRAAFSAFDAAATSDSAAFAAFARAGRAARAARATRAATRAFAAFSAAADAADAAADATFAAFAAADAADAASAAVWRAVSVDACRLLEGRGGAIALFKQPLWPREDGIPDWFIRAWSQLKSAPGVEKDGFAPWIEWYEGLVPLGGYRQPINIFGPDLSQRIALQADTWWKQGAKEINADIARWLAEERGKTWPPDPPEHIEKILANLAPQEPTAYIYRPEKGRVVARPILADPTDPDGAQVYLAELCDKATALATDLSSKHNYFDNDWIVDAVTKLRDYLWEGAEPRPLARLNPHLLHSRLRPVKEIADGYQLPPDVEAAYREFKPRIRDVAGAGEDLELCLQPLRRLEAERIARALPEDPAGQETTRQHLADFVTAIQAVDPAVVDDSAKVALETEKALADELASPAERRNRLADSLLNARNLGGAVVKLIGDILLRKIKSIESGVDDGLKASGKYITIAGGVAFVASVLSPSLMGLANTPGFHSILEAIKALKPFLDMVK